MNLKSRADSTFKSRMCRGILRDVNNVLFSTNSLAKLLSDSLLLDSLLLDSLLSDSLISQSHSKM